jgi:hypothetical protein
MTWDGEGIDPWMSERMAAEAALVAAEQGVFQAYWAELSSWLVAVYRAVMSGGRLMPPDPAAVWSKAPAWDQAAADVVNGPIRDTMGLAYDAIFGPGYQFDARPAVASHLAQVTNRMVNTPAQVFDLVSEQIADGAGKGEGIPKLADRVERVLSTTQTDLWPNRAVTVARTETIGALNAGRWDSFAALSQLLGENEPMETQWLATSDARTRPTHREADLQRIPVGGTFTVGGAQLRFPGDPTGPAKEVINCRCSTLLVRQGEDVDLSNRQFTDW